MDLLSINEELGGSGGSANMEKRLLEIKRSVQKALQEASQRTDPIGSAEQQDVLTSSDPNASFHLGMELFGSEPALIEESIQENLQKLERQLKDLLIEWQVREGNNNNDEDDRNIDDIENEKSPPMQASAAFLQFRIQYLKQASQIRQCIEEAAVLADPSASLDEGPNLVVRAMQKLLEAERLWQQTKDMIDHSDNANQEEEETVAEVARAQHLMELLRQDIRDPKAQLIDEVTRLWNSCISLGTETLVVGGFLPSSASDGGQESALDQVYGVLDVLSSTNDGDSLLHELVLPFATRLHDDVFAPVLETHRKSGGGVVCWEFHESHERSASAALGSSVVTTTTSSTKSKRGVVKRLEWSRDEDKTTEKDPIAAWGETMQFLQRILAFVADNALLGRPAVCQLVGQRLLGRPAVGSGANESSKSAAFGHDLRLHELGVDSFRLHNDHGILMGPMVDLMMETCLPDYVAPDNLISQLGDTQTRLDAMVTPFLETLQEHALLLQSNDDDEQKSAVRQLVDKFVPRYIDHRHSLKLHTARTILLHKDYHNTQQVGVDPLEQQQQRDPHAARDAELGLDHGLDVFVLHKSCISETALELYQTCVECMDEAVATAKALEKVAGTATPNNTTLSSLSALPASLYHAARQVLDLYRAIVPVRYGKEAAHVPRTAAIWYNDCVYLAHHCLTLGLRYRDQFPPESHVGRVCLFVDMVPLFRDMATRCLRQMLDRQAHEIHQLVHDRLAPLTAALRNPEIVAEWADAETALHAGLYHISHVAQQWQPLLSQKVFSSTIGYLAHVLFTLFLQPVMAATDFSTDACQFVHGLFGRALDQVHALLVSSRGEGGNVVVVVEQSVPSWNRLKAVGQFMDMTLNDVEAALSQGVFASLTGQELTHLLQATFDESPRRQELLRLCKSGS